VDIATGNSESHPVLQSSVIPATALPTAVMPGPLSGPSPVLESGVRDLTGERLADLETIEADCRAAQSAGMAAEMDRRNGYHADILPPGADYGALMDLPPVPANAVPVRSQRPAPVERG
jgi:hypothetical protein